MSSRLSSHMFLALLMLGGLTVEGCTSSPSPPASAPAPAPSASVVAVSTSAPLLLPSGIRVTDLKVGTSSTSFETATHARVRLVERVGDKTIVTREDFEFKLAGKSDYPGLVEGMRGMRLGGIRRIEVPPGLAYGAKGKAPDIPPDSTVVYEVYIKALQLPPFTMPSGASALPVPGGAPITVSPRSNATPPSPLPAPR